MVDRTREARPDLQYVREALRQEPFPLDREGLYYAIGSAPIRQSSGLEVPARDLIDRCPRSQFQSADEVIDALKEAAGFSAERALQLAHRVHRASGLGLARGLGWFSIGLGLVEVLAPRWLARHIGAPRKTGMLRAFGVREILTGVAVLLDRRPLAPIGGRLAGDAIDLAALAMAARSRRANPARLTFAAGSVLAVTALDALCASKLARSSSNKAPGTR